MLNPVGIDQCEKGFTDISTVEARVAAGVEGRSETNTWALPDQSENGVRRQRPLICNGNCETVRCRW